VRFEDLVRADSKPADAIPAQRESVATDSYVHQLSRDPRNNGFVTGLVDRRRARRMSTTRRGFLRGTIATAAATTALTAANLFGPARKVEAQTGIVGSYPRRIMQFCPPYNANDNCQPGCGSSPICTDCCSADGFFRNDPGNGYSLYAGGCGDGDIADGWLWRFAGKCGQCAEIEYRCSDGYVQTDTGPAPFICRSVTSCVPLAEGEAAGEALPDAARDTNWRPAGSLEVAIDNGSSVTLNGWIADGSGVPVPMRIRANNAIVHFGTAALPRPDIASTRSGAGPNTGFAVSFPLEPGQYEFCVDALAGALAATVGCIRMNVGDGGSVRGGGSTGSIAPPAATAVPQTEPESGDDTTSDESTADVADSPTPTPTVGEIVLPEEGPQSPTRAYGSVQVIRRSGATTGFVSGWAGDADSDEPTVIDVHVDSQSVALTATDLPRPDVGRAFSTLGPATGFALSFVLPEVPTQVCVYAVSPDDGRRTPLGCRDLGPTETEAERDTPTTPTGSGNASTIDAVVYGGLDLVDITPTGITVDGWSFDPNDRDRVIALTAEASGVEARTATGQTNETAQRIYGVDARCGFSLALALGSGSHDLTVNAEAADGSQIVIAQQTIQIP